MSVSITAIDMSKSSIASHTQRGALAFARHEATWTASSTTSHIAYAVYDTIDIGAGSVLVYAKNESVDQAMLVRLQASADGATYENIDFKDELGTTTSAGTDISLAAGVNEVVTLTEGVNITGGTFTLTFGGQTTAALAHDITAAQLQAALENLSSIGAGNITVTGGILTTTPFTLTFKGTLARTNVGSVTSNQASLTGTFTIAVATPGSAGGDAYLIVSYASFPEYSAFRFFRAKIEPFDVITLGGTVVLNANIK